MSESEINQTLDNRRRGIDKNIQMAQQQYKDTQTQVIENKEALADAAGKYGILMFVLLGLGTLASFLGGALGAPELFVREEHREEVIA